LSTIAPWLKIAHDGNNVILTWPSLATNYQLETASGLASANAWNAVTNTPDVNRAINTLTLPAMNRSAFFRLAPLGF
jgi:hypothetical protein